MCRELDLTCSDWNHWRQSGEAFAQQWSDTCCDDDGAGTHTTSSSSTFRTRSPACPYSTIHRPIRLLTFRIHWTAIFGIMFLSITCICSSYARWCSIILSPTVNIPSTRCTSSFRRWSRQVQSFTTRKNRICADCIRCIHPLPRWPKTRCHIKAMLLQWFC